MWLLDWRVGLIAWESVRRPVAADKIRLPRLRLRRRLHARHHIFFFCGQSLLYTVLAVLIAALVIWCHRENITRLLHHQERKFQWHTGTPKEKE